MSSTEPAISRVGGGLAHAGARIARLIGAIELAFRVRRERRILLAMDDRMLKDLGLNGIAYAEASRPFWDVPVDRLRRPKPCGARSSAESSTDQGPCR
jgi:uncharacterized protein YjiS (DUF1127 family)